MVKHIVLWKLKETQPASDKKLNAIKMKKMIEQLANVVPGAYRIEVGINYNPGGYDVALCSEFNDHDALGMTITVLPPERAGTLIEALRTLLDGSSGVMFITETRVSRPEYFQ